MTELLHPSVLLPWMLAMLFGVFVGATPGLTATMAVALIIPLTFHVPDANTSLAMILGISFTAIFAGDIPATYLRIPGTPASAAGTLDGHPLARAGRGREALYLNLLCSCLGGLFSVLVLMAVAPQLARWALRFSHYEYFWLAVVGLSLSAAVSVGSTARGLLAAVLGVLLATIGIDGLSGVPRFTYGQMELMDGLGFIPAMIGLFGLSEVFRNIRQPRHVSALNTGQEAKVNLPQLLRTLWRHKFLMLRSSSLGTVVGALPGAGADIAAWASYGLAQRLSKTPQRFGTGVAEGVIAPTSANNAAVGGAWIPALVFGIPGDSLTAIVLGALLMYDIKPGPLIFEQSPDQVRSIFLIALITQFLLLLAGWAGIRAFSYLLRVPRQIVMTCVVIFSVVGAYAIRNSVFDIWLMAGFGLLGYFLESRRVPLGPLILGLILGPMLEKNLRTGLIKSSGSLAPFFERPICLALIALLILAATAPLLTTKLLRFRAREAKPVSDPSDA